MAQSIATVAPEQENPYIGPRPFETGEKTRFFGRDREADLLIPLIISERLVLFYAQSGAGKSSLLNAKIIPALRERNFITLSGRVSGSELSKAEVRNIFIYNLLVSLDPEKSKKNDLRHTTLSDYLADLDVNDVPSLKTDNIPLDAPPIINGVQPLVLIIDQFEEIFNTHPEAYDQRGPFFDQLCEAMQNDPYLWVVLTIREDYVAQLDPYAGQMPGRMRARFYMQRMKKDAAMDAVAKPVEHTSPFDAKAVEELVKSLSMIAVGRDENRSTIYQEGEFVEPVQLQVVCYQLWENLKPQPGSTITLENIQQVAGDQELTSFIVRALREYYEGVLTNVLQETRSRARPISERALREWFSTALITEDRTRASVFRGDTHTGTLPNHVVDLLERRFIIRGEMRAGGRWYELVHDRLIQPIRSSNSEWLAANTTKLEKDAQAWKQKPEQSKLYDGRQLKEALELQKKGELTPLENEFIRESQEESERKRAAARRNRRLLIGSALAAVFFLIIALFAMYSWGLADRATRAAEVSRATAVSAQALALSEKAAAEAASTQVAVQRNEAEQARKAADAAKIAAVAEAERAEQALQKQVQSDQQTFISRLAAYAKYYVGEPDEKDLSLLFAVEAWKQKSDSWEAREALSYTLWWAHNDDPYNILVSDYPEEYISPDSGVFAVDINKDGNRLATGGRGGLVNVWNLETGEQVEAPDGLQSSFIIYTLQFSPDGRYLAVGGGEGRVKFWDMQEDRMLTPYRPDGKEALIHALAFDPTSRLAAVGLGDGRLMIYSMDQRKKVKELYDPSGDIWSVAWSPVGSRVAYGGKNGVIRVYNMETQKEEKVLSNVLNNPVQGLVWSNDGRYIFAGGQDRLLIRWEVDAQGFQVARSIKEDTQGILSLDLNKEGSVLVSGNANPDVSLTLWDTRTLRPVGYPMGNNSWVRSVAFDPQGKYFASGGDDFRAFVLEVRSLDPLAKLRGSVPGGGIVALGIDPQEGLVALKRLGTGTGESLQLYSVSTLKPLGSAYLARYDALQLVEHSGQLVLFLARNNEVLLLDPRTGQPLENKKPVSLPDLPVTAMGIRPDGKVLGVAMCDATSPEGDICIRSRLLFWDLDAGREMWSPTTDHYVTGLGISPNDQVVVGRDDGNISYYPFDQSLKVLVDGEKSFVSYNAVIRTDFSPDGKLFFTSTYQGDLQIWDPVERRLINYIGNANVENDFVSGAVFETDDQNRLRLFTGSWFGHVYDWDVDPASWASRACGLVSGDMEPEIWNQNFPNNQKLGPICPLP